MSQTLPMNLKGHEGASDLRVSSAGGLFPYVLVANASQHGTRWSVIGPGIDGAVFAPGFGADAYEEAGAMAERFLAWRENPDAFAHAVEVISTYCGQRLPCVIAESIVVARGEPIRSRFASMSKSGRVHALLRLLRVRRSYAPAIARSSGMGRMSDWQFSA